MKLTIVVAASENNVIGRDNNMPWHLPDDFRFFKKMTMDKPVIMGRNTFVSLGKILPGRLNIIISSSMKEAPAGVQVFDTVGAALAYLEKEGITEASIIGGGQIYNATLGITDIVYLTRIHTVIDDGTTFFPELDKDEWQLTWQEYHPKDEKHLYDFTFQKWERIK